VLQFPGVRFSGFDSRADASALDEQTRTEIPELRQWPSIRRLATGATELTKWQVFTGVGTDPTNVLVQMD
jgi:hypothetical protein